MTTARSRLFALLDTVVPQDSALTTLSCDLTLYQLGFDSLALVSLFIEMEAEFKLSLHTMQGILHRRCTVKSLLDVCAAHT